MIDYLIIDIETVNYILKLDCLGYIYKYIYKI